jgi:MFS family permease
MAREPNQPPIARASAVRSFVDRVTGRRRGRLEAADAATRASPTPRPGRRLVSAVLAGTLLNPLNSSMIAVVLGLIQADFRISVATASWLLSSFALAAAVAQPVMGRLADLFGPRRIFGIGLLVVGVASGLAPLAPAFGWLIACRMLQAFGTSAAYPAGLAIIRAVHAQGQAPAGTLGAINITSSVSVALGPVLGGFLAAHAGWPAIFLANVPLTAVGLLLAWRWLPADALPGRATMGAAPSHLAVVRTVLRRVDVPGIALFSGMLASLLVFLLSLSGSPRWALLPVVLLAAVLLVCRERGVAEPFLNVRMLAAHRPLISVYAQFAGVNIVFYAIFFSLPLWLERVRGFESSLTGLLLLPVAGVGILATPVAARLISQCGPGPALITGAGLLTVGSLLLLVCNATTPVSVILAVGVVLGIPNGFNNLGLQAALYEHAPAQHMGAAGGQFQTFRYVGAILSTSLLGLAFGRTVSSHGFHLIAYVLACISGLLLVASVTTRQRRRVRGE